MSTPIRTEHPHIVKVPGIAGGAPVIAGTRITVALIARLLRAGDEPAEIIASYPHLAPAAVYDAISYYLDHQPEIDRYIEENTLEQLAERHRFVVGDDGKVIDKDACRRVTGPERIRLKLARGYAMLRFVTPVLLALLLMPPLSAARAESVGAQADCSFSPAFAVLRDQIPDVVGQCLEDQHLNPASGDLEQRTTGGLLVRRKATYRIAFTDGQTVWIHDPLALTHPELLARRPVDRAPFSWEEAPSPTDEGSACRAGLAAFDPWHAYAWTGEKEDLAPIDRRPVVLCIASGGSEAARSPFADVGVGCLLVGGELAWIEDEPACGRFLGVERRGAGGVVWTSRGPGVDQVAILDWNGSRFDVREAYLECLTSPGVRVELPRDCDPR